MNEFYHAMILLFFVITYFFIGFLFAKKVHCDFDVIPTFLFWPVWIWQVRFEKRDKNKNG